jgi:hypothetical protein
MSINLMSAIFRTEFRDLQDADGNNTKASTAKFVCLALADHANDEGEGAYPSIGKLAYKTSLSRTAVINALDAMKHNGILAANGTSKWDTVNYTVNPDCFSQGSQPAILVNPIDSPSQVDILPPVNPLDPNHPLTVLEPSIVLTEKEIQQVNAKVDAIIANGQNVNNWKGRETFAPQDYPLVDWYHKVTGQDCPKAKSKDWHKAVVMWSNNNLTVEHLQAAYDMDVKWRGVFTSPNQLTDKAIALKAKGGRKTDDTKGSYHIQDIGDREL